MCNIKNKLHLKGAYCISACRYLFIIERNMNNTTLGYFEKYYKQLDLFE